MAARGGNTEVIVELAKAGANVDLLNRVCFLLYIILLICTCMYTFGRVGVSHVYGKFHHHIYCSTNCRQCVLRANIKPAHSKFKGCTFSANFVTTSNSTTPCCLSTTDHPWAWTVLMPAERLSIWTGPQPRYAFSAVNHSNRLVPQFIKCAMCSSLWSDVV